MKQNFLKFLLIVFVAIAILTVFSGCADNANLNINENESENQTQESDESNTAEPDIYIEELNITDEPETDLPEESINPETTEQTTPPENSTEVQIKTENITEQTEVNPVKIIEIPTQPPTQSQPLPQPPKQNTEPTEPATVPVESIYVETDKNRYKTGETAGLKVTVYPSDATDKSYDINITGSGGELAGDGSNSIICNTDGITTVTATASNGVSGKRDIDIINLEQYAAEVFRLTNVERQKAGLPDLIFSEALKNTAAVRVKEIMTLFYHERPDGSSIQTAFDENNVSYRVLGENIAVGQPTPEEVVKSWMDSPSHRANILYAKFGRLGIGIEMDSAGKIYWSQSFTD